MNAGAVIIAMCPPTVRSFYPCTRVGQDIWNARFAENEAGRKRYWERNRKFLFHKSAVCGKNRKWECFVNLIHEKYRVESSQYFFYGIKLLKKGGIPPEFFEFVCLNQKRVLVKDSKVPWKNCKNQWKVPWKSCKNREKVPWKSWFLFDLCFQEARNIPWKEGTFIANDSIFLLMQFSIVMI